MYKTKKNTIKKLIDAYEKTGRVAHYYPRKKQISLDGFPAMDEKTAIKKMMNTISHHNSLNNINEGLQVNDLHNTVLDEISIDLYEPRAGKEESIIVVGFEMIDESPAKDLEEFIRMGYLDVLDTDVSPGPNLDGNYLVFIEFERNKTFPLILFKLLVDIKAVVANNKWKFKGYPNKKIVSLTPKNILKEIVLDKEKYLQVKKMHDKKARTQSSII